VVVLAWVILSLYTFREFITVLATCRTLIGGLRYPILAAVGCGLWSFTRILYTIRYGTGEPKKVFLFLLKVTLVFESYS
jgi:hypothetical protein